MKSTQLETLRNHLRVKGSISSIEAEAIYKIRRLASRIHELRLQGMQINSLRRKDPTGQRYIRYETR